MNRFFFGGVARGGEARFHVDAAIMDIMHGATRTKKGGGKATTDRHNGGQGQDRRTERSHGRCGDAVRCRLTTRRVLVVIYVTWRPLGRDGDDHDCVRGVRATVSETKTEMACPRTKGSTAEVSFTVTAAGQIL